MITNTKRESISQEPIREVFHSDNLPEHFWTSFDGRSVQEIAPYLRNIISFTQIFRVIPEEYSQGVSYEEVFEKIFAQQISEKPEDFLAVFSLFPEDPHSDWNEERMVTLIAMDLIRRHQTRLPKHAQARWMKDLAQTILHFRSVQKIPPLPTLKSWRKLRLLNND